MQYRNKIETGHAEKERKKNEEKTRMMLNNIETKFEAIVKETEAKFDQASKKEKKLNTTMKDELERKMTNLLDEQSGIVNRHFKVVKQINHVKDQVAKEKAKLKSLKTKLHEKSKAVAAAATVEGEEGAVQPPPVSKSPTESEESESDSAESND